MKWFRRSFSVALRHKTCGAGVFSASPNIDPPPLPFQIPVVDRIRPLVQLIFKDGCPGAVNDGLVGDDEDVGGAIIAIGEHVLGANLSETDISNATGGGKSF